ncbi:glycosyltransferase [Raineyella sp.]|uniref:Glycosyltransferase 2-like domain-containing protein n=1 Tax=bioreactor metagenome TaxID=1076179 RepID=A0A644Z4X8_9ZZZZ|nr:glycosyltransferase [Raineyella sp.]MEA5153964.1 glycosyltransferase [Raineyella sp.]
MTLESSKPEISVLIPYFKSLKTLPAQLDALAAQDDPPLFEVLVADNERADHLNEVAERYHNRLQIRVIDAYQARGVGPARNRAVQESRGEYIAFCDSDDIVAPHWLSSLIEILRESDVLATGPLRLDSLNSEPVWRAFLNIENGTAVARPVLLNPFTYLNYERFAYGCNIAIRRETYLRLGGMDVSLLGGSEDVEFSWRAIENGVRIEVAPNAIVNYRLRSEPAGILRQKRNYMRSQVHLWAKSRQIGRPVRGMSFRWAVTQTVKLLPSYIRSRRGGNLKRLQFAHQAGGILGNLEGQVRFRIAGGWARKESNNKN